jgi:acyl-CoA thioester hydrolase
MYTFETQIRVRYAETDQMGYVYYGNYPMYYEVARVECLRSLGYSYKKLEEEGIMMPVLENNSKYIEPARYDDLLTIKLSIPKPPGVKIAFEYDFLNEEGKMIHQGKTLLAFINKETRRPSRPPKIMLDLLNPFFE